MRTIVISDIAFVGNTYQEAKDGLLYLKDLQKNGYNVVLMTNKGYKDAHFLCLKFVKRNKVTLENITTTYPKNKGFELHFRKLYESYYLKENYLIIGNGSKILSENQKVIWESEKFPKETLEKLKQMLKSFDYLSEKEYKERENEKIIGSYYRYLTLKESYSLEERELYGIECSKRTLMHDFAFHKYVEEKIPEIKGYYLDSKPTFYLKERNKRLAIQKLWDLKEIDPENTYFILSNLTDDVFLDMDPSKTYLIGDEFSNQYFSRKEDSLVRALEKIDS